MADPKKLNSLQASSVWFEAPRSAALRTENIESLKPDHMLVEAIVSLVSTGTEMLVYRGLVSADTPFGLETCRGSFGFPVKYGYQVVGRVIDVGSEVSIEPGQVVFCKHPHQDLFTIRECERLVWKLPADVDPIVASFIQLANVALNAHLDVPVRLGDEVAVFGQGIIGQLCALFARKTAERVYVVDPNPRRQERAERLGFDAVLEPEGSVEQIRELTNGRGVDVVFEVSGSPDALQKGIEVVGQEGTIVAVSYYGTKPVALTLAPQFHFGRHRIISSQAAYLGSGLQPRWDRERRAHVALSLLQGLPVRDMVSHEFDLASAPEAYDLIDSGAEDVYGVLLKYDQRLWKDKESA